MRQESVCYNDKIQFKAKTLASRFFRVKIGVDRISNDINLNYMSRQNATSVLCLCASSISKYNFQSHSHDVFINTIVNFISIAPMKQGSKVQAQFK